jgi:hypothetical protein
MTATGGDSVRYLYGRLGIVEARVRAAVAARRAGDPDPDDRFRGLYLSDSLVDGLLAGRSPGGFAGPAATDEEGRCHLAEVEAWAGTVEAGGGHLALRQLAVGFGLDMGDLEILVIAMAPDLDPRFERLYAYLNDDVSRRRATVGLALELCGSISSERDRLRFSPHGPLVSGGLLSVEDPDAPVLGRPLRVPDRVVAHLLGDPTPEASVGLVLTECVAGEVAPAAGLDRGLEGGARLCYLRERSGSAGFSAAAAALRRVGLACIALDLKRLAPADDVAALAAAAAREARFVGGALVAGPVETLADRGAEAIRAFTEVRCPLVLIGQRAWDPQWSRSVPLEVDAPLLSAEGRGEVWRAALVGGVASGLDAGRATVQFRLSPEQVVRAARAAHLHAVAAGVDVGVAELHAGARSQNAAGLERLARRLEPRVGWSDLVLPSDPLSHLHELTARARHRDLVLDDWGMGRTSSRGRGVTALFAGESGTGKTMAAEVIAADLGLHLYVIDLSTVVDKYVGETEKNLERIFVEADRVNAVLLFDEADAIFGKRSEVSDAHDRYANVEVAYLLQRMERFEGLAILTTNLRANVDEAFTRRLDVVVDFPMPEAEDRRRLWGLHLGPGVPRRPDIDLDFLARAFRLSGGNIHNIVLGAAFLAAAEGDAVGMSQLIRSTEREYRKLGHLCVPDEFGSYYDLIKPRVDAFD